MVSQVGISIRGVNTWDVNRRCNLCSSKQLSASPAIFGEQITDQIVRPIMNMWNALPAP